MIDNVSKQVPYAWSDPSSDSLALSAVPQRADWLLRIAVLIHAIGVAIALFSRNSSSLGEIALMEWGIPHPQIFLGEKVAATILVALAASVFVYPTSFALVAIAGLVFAEAYAGFHCAGHELFQYTMLAESLRYLAPLALLLLIFSRSIAPSEVWRSKAAAWILRVGLAIVFFTHGLEALRQHSGFIDLILGSARNVLGLSLTETFATRLLFVIGWLDVAVAALVLVRPSRPLLAWLCFWGLITALSRPVGLGFGAYPEVLVRAAHFLAPIAVWWLTFPPNRSENREPAASLNDSTDCAKSW